VYVTVFCNLKPSALSYKGTSEPGSYTYSHNGKTIRLIDTPGFDDTNRSDTDILKDIAFFLSTIYTKKVKLAGIIYLHRITDVRMTGSSYKNLQMLEKLCGDSALSKVVLASTMWNLLGRPGSDHTLEVGEQREAMLKGKFWGSMESKGSLVTRHYGDAASGQAIASRLLSNESAVVLDIQREMVDEGLSLDRTAAGMFLQSDHLKLRQKYERELLDAQEALEDALKEKDSELAAQFAKQRDDCQSALLRADADQSSLRVDLSSLLAEKDAHYASLAAEMAKEKKARETEARFIEQNLADLRDALDKQEQDHKEEMNRMRRSQNTKTAVEQERVAQLAAQYERRHADMMAQIAAVEEERRRKAARGLGRLVSSGFQSFLDFFGVGDAEPYYEPRRRELRKGEMRQYHGGTGGDGGWGRQRNAYYDR